MFQIAASDINSVAKQTEGIHLYLTRLAHVRVKVSDASQRKFYSLVKEAVQLAKLPFPKHDNWLNDYINVQRNLHNQLLI